MTLSRKGTSPAGKFARIRDLPAAAPHSAAPVPASPGSHEVRPTLANLLRLRGREADAVETDIHIHRHRYTQLVLEMSKKERHFNSVGVFVEAMLREVSLRECTDIATRAAAATWALNLLASQSAGGALSSIAESILPALYYQYNAAQLDHAPPMIHAQLETSLLHDNPYFTHTMYVEQVNIDRRKAAELSDRLFLLVRANDGRRDYIVRTVNERRTGAMRRVFIGWRTHVRRAHILAFTDEKRSRRHAVVVSRLQLRVIFAQWKVLLEASRNGFLTERLHQSALLLENAKNQFQLQCYRSDRLMQETAKVKEELATVMPEVERLRYTIRQMEEEMVRREAEYKENLQRSVCVAFYLIKTYRSLVSHLLETRIPKGDYIDDRMASEPKEAVHTSCDAFSSAAEVDTPGHILLLRWCNSVLNIEHSDNNHLVTGFGRDFFTGDVYTRILHHVFPDAVPLSLLREVNQEYRLRRIADICEKLQLQYVVTPDDFLMQREDCIALSLGELYTRYIRSRWRQSASEAAERATKEFAEPSFCPEGEIPVDDEVFHTFVKECYQHVTYIRTEFARQTQMEVLAIASMEAIARQEVFLAVERAKGQPVPLLGDRSTASFWKLPVPKIDYLEKKYVSGRQPLTEDVCGPLRDLLREHVDTLTRVFRFYAGEDAVEMSEVAFWSFVDRSGLAVPPLSRMAVSQVFDQVASPQLAALLRTAAHSHGGMNEQTLQCVAEQEIDIRHIQPQQFVEILVRLGVHRSSGATDIIESTRSLLEIMRVPPRSSLPHFLLHMLEAHTMNVLDFFCDDMARVYFFYVKLQESSRDAQQRALAIREGGGRFIALLSYTMFLQMLKDCEYLANDTDDTIRGRATVQERRLFVTSEEVLRVLHRLGELYFQLRTGEMSFTLFVEGLVVISNFWCPDPLVPHSRRVAAFLADCVRQLNVKHAKTTLLLSAPPHVSLEGGPKVDLRGSAYT